MMAHRQTIKITTLIEEVNRLNKVSSVSPEVRKGWNSLLEKALHKNNVYAGFGYYEKKELEGPAREEDCEGGIIWGFHPTTGERDKKYNQYPDESRRYYYIHSKLKERENS